MKLSDLIYIRQAHEYWDFCLRKHFQLPEQDWDNIQKEKMKELWDNEYDEIWNSV